MGKNDINIDKCNELIPGIIVVDDVLPNVEKFHSLAKPLDFENALIGVQGNATYNPQIRTTMSTTILPTAFNDIDNCWMDLCRVIWKWGDAYGKYYSQPFAFMEPPQLLYYKQYKGFYGPHIDNGAGQPRTFSAILYLNTVEEGGETIFPHFNLSIHPKAGRLAIFPATHPFLHEASPPSSNDKFCVVTWFSPIL